MYKSLFCKMDKSFWHKDSWTTHIHFELWLIMKFSPTKRKLAKPTTVYWGPTIKNAHADSRVLGNVKLIMLGMIY